jgi:hypothetical protein
MLIRFATSWKASAAWPATMEATTLGEINVLHIARVQAGRELRRLGSVSSLKARGEALRLDADAITHGEASPYLSSADGASL